MIVKAISKVVLDDYAGTEVSIPVHRHEDCLYICEQLLGYKPIVVAEGFLTDEGVFLDRRAAALHAYDEGQLIEDAETERIEVLMSEDLW